MFDQLYCAPTKAVKLQNASKETTGSDIQVVGVWDFRYALDDPENLLVYFLHPGN